MSKLFNAIGMMSGTSMDGVDVALIASDGLKTVERRAFASFPYDEAFCGRLRQALSDAEPMKSREARPGCLAEVEQELTDRHAAAVLAFLEAHGLRASDIDLIGFHGQTVLHRPDDQLTVQIGDGAHLSSEVGIDVVFDLRAADVAAGGQGAPLAPVYHGAIAAMLGGEPVAVLNIGGVANVTFVDGNGDLTAFDTGPGNALLDDFIFARTGDRCDEGGRYSSNGKVDQGVLARLMQDAYFAAPPPKSLDRNYFPAGALKSLSLEDGAATLAAFTVAAVSAAKRCAEDVPQRWIVTGGGRHNKTIMAGLQSQLSAEVITAEDIGFNGDAIEAEAWAYLAIRSKLGLPISFPGTTGVAKPLAGGVLVPGR